MNSTDGITIGIAFVVLMMSVKLTIIYSRLDRIIALLERRDGEDGK